MKTASPRHSHVEHQTSRAIWRIGLEKIGNRRKLPGLHADRAQETRNRIAKLAIVIDEQDTWDQRSARIRSFAGRSIVIDDTKWRFARHCHLQVFWISSCLPARLERSCRRAITQTGDQRMPPRGI